MSSKEYKKSWRLKNLDKARATDRAWAEKNREKIKEYESKRKERLGKNFRQGRHLKSTYGISLETYNALLSSQGGLCAICEDPPLGTSPQTNKLSVDHDHMTGAVRGLLCHHCNLSLGGFRDDVARLEKAIAYLKKHGRG